VDFFSNGSGWCILLYFKVVSRGLDMLALSAAIDENEAKETGVPLSNLMSYIAVNYVREEKKKRSIN
jgi:hypothetical protein